MSTIKSLCTHYAPLANPEKISSSHALDMLAEIHAEAPAEREKAHHALDLLARKYDPIRANYWNYRKSLVH